MRRLLIDRGLLLLLGVLLFLVAVGLIGLVVR